MTLFTEIVLIATKTAKLQKLRFWNSVFAVFGMTATIIKIAVSISGFVENGCFDAIASYLTINVRKRQASFTDGEGVLDSWMIG